MVPPFRLRLIRARIEKQVCLVIHLPVIPSPLEYPCPLDKKNDRQQGKSTFRHGSSQAVSASSLYISSLSLPLRRCFPLFEPPSLHTCVYLHTPLSFTCILGSIRPSTLAFMTRGHWFRRSATSDSCAPSSSRKKAALGRKLPVTLRVRSDG